MKHYSQLTLEKRYGIFSLLKTGQTQSKIAEVVGIINMFLKINWPVVLCISIYVAKRRERSVMDPMTNGGT